MEATVTGEYSLGKGLSLILRSFEDSILARKGVL